MAMTHGNMSIEDNVNGVTKVKCHCRETFDVVVSYDKGVPNSRNGTVINMEDNAVTCPSCGCYWRLKTYDAAKLPKDPKWRYFQLAILIKGQETYTDAIIGAALDYPHFMTTVSKSIEKIPDFKSMAITELTADEYLSALEADNKANRERVEKLIYGFMF